MFILVQMHEKAVKLYAELAEVAVKSFLISKDSPVIEPVRIHTGAEENKEALRKSRGEDDEDFQILEYQAQKGNAGAMYKIGIFYYFGLRGVRRDHAKALRCFSKAVEKGEPRSMELLGEIYARGAGVERNYTKALEWLTLAARQQLYSAYNGMGYLYVKGYGVEKKNYTRVLSHFSPLSSPLPLVLNFFCGSPNLSLFMTLFIKEICFGPYAPNFFCRQKNTLIKLLKRKNLLGSTTLV